MIIYIKDINVEKLLFKYNQLNELKNDYYIIKVFVN